LERVEEEKAPPMSSIRLPELIAILWMAVVLARLRRWQANDTIHLWIVGLFLFVVEGLARIIYLMPGISNGLHGFMHVIALDSYFLAGVAFFQSATGKLRLLPKSDIYIFLCSVPHLFLLTLYGSGSRSHPWYIAIAVGGFLLSLGAGAYLKRPALHWVCQIVIWSPIIATAVAAHYRLLAYVSLFFAYIATAIAFYLTLPKPLKGRAVVVAGFCIWSLCFITHPWVAEHAPYWVPLAERIWDLQKFFVMFGLLIVSLEEYSATNEYQALHDMLTGLPNRRLFDDRLEQALARTQRNHSRVVLFNMDLDAFKQVNDTYGHEAGDELLREAGRRLLAVTRGTDTLARMGGDEFYLLLNDFSPQTENGSQPSAAEIAEQTYHICESFRNAVEKEPCRVMIGNTPQDLYPRLSIGFVIFPDEATNRDELCRLADEKMYADKKRRSEASPQLAPAAASL
jgi:diguanylate cyclase